MALRLITAPIVEPISLVEAKAHLRVDHDEEDDLITLLIMAARSYVDGKDGWLGRALVTQTWELVIDEFPAAEIKIPLPPLQEVISIKYDDSEGVEQTLATDQYFVDNVSEPGWVVPVTSWPTPIVGVNAVRIRYDCGYPGSNDSPSELADNVPSSIKAAMLLTIGSLYANRETVIVGNVAAKLPWGAEQLLRDYRVQIGIA